MRPAQTFRWGKSIVRACRHCRRNVADAGSDAGGRFALAAPLAGFGLPPLYFTLGQEDLCMAAASNRRASLVLSLDVPAVMRSAEADLRRVGQLLVARQAAATWCVSPGDGLSSVAEIAAGSELVWRADASWAAGNAPRGQFATALADRLRAATQAGVAVDGLALRGVTTPAHLDLASKYGMRVLSGDPAMTRGVSQPQALRFGVRHVAVNVALSANRTAWWTNQTRAAIAAIDRAIKAQAVCHLHADAARPETPAVLDRVLAHAQRRRVEGVLSMETVGQAAGRVARPQVTDVPARSILRVA
jgi:hypothetical protein